MTFGAWLRAGLAWSLGLALLAAAAPVSLAPNPGAAPAPEPVEPGSLLIAPATTPDHPQARILQLPLAASPWAGALFAAAEVSDRSGTHLAQVWTPAGGGAPGRLQATDEAVPNDGAVLEDGAVSDDGAASDDDAVADDGAVPEDGAVSEDGTVPDDGAVPDDPAASDDGAPLAAQLELRDEVTASWGLTPTWTRNELRVMPGQIAEFTGEIQVVVGQTTTLLGTLTITNSEPYPRSVAGVQVEVLDGRSPSRMLLTRVPDPVPLTPEELADLQIGPAQGEQPGQLVLQFRHDWTAGWTQPSTSWQPDRRVVPAGVVVAATVPTMAEPLQARLDRLGHSEHTVSTNQSAVIELPGRSASTLEVSDALYGWRRPFSALLRTNPAPGTCTPSPELQIILLPSDAEPIVASEFVTLCTGTDLAVSVSQAGAVETSLSWGVTVAPTSEPAQAAGADGWADFDFLVTVLPQIAAEPVWRVRGAITIANANPLELVAHLEPTWHQADGCVLSQARATDDGGFLVAATGEVTVEFECLSLTEPEGLAGLAGVLVTWNPLEASSTSSFVELPDRTITNQFPPPLGVAEFAAPPRPQDQTVTVETGLGEFGDEELQTLGQCRWSASGEPCVFHHSRRLPGPLLPETEALHPLTARVVESGRAARAAVLVTAAPLSFEASLHGTSRQHYDWSLRHSVDPAIVWAGQEPDSVRHSVTVAVTKRRDRWEVHARARITNPNPFPVTVTDGSFALRPMRRGNALADVRSDWVSIVLKPGHTHEFDLLWLDELPPCRTPAAPGVRLECWNTVTLTVFAFGELAGEWSVLASDFEPEVADNLMSLTVSAPEFSQRFANNGAILLGARELLREGGARNYTFHRPAAAGGTELCHSETTSAQLRNISSQQTSPQTRLASVAQTTCPATVPLAPADPGTPEVELALSLISAADAETSALYEVRLRNLGLEPARLHGMWLSGAVGRSLLGPEPYPMLEPGAEHLIYVRVGQPISRAAPRSASEPVLAALPSPAVATRPASRLGSVLGIWAASEFGHRSVGPTPVQPCCPAVAAAQRRRCPCQSAETITD